MSDLRPLRSTPSNPEIKRTRSPTAAVSGNIAEFDKIKAARASKGFLDDPRLRGVKKPTGVDHLKAGGGIYGTLGRKRRPMSTAMFGRGVANPFQTPSSNAVPAKMIEEPRSENLSREMRLLATYFQEATAGATKNNASSQHSFHFLDTMADSSFQKPVSKTSSNDFEVIPNEYEAWEEHLLDTIAKEAFTNTGAFVDVSDLRSKSIQDMMAEAEEKIQLAQSQQLSPPSLGVTRAKDDNSPVASLRGHPERRGSKTLSTKWSTLTRTKKNDRRSSREIFNVSSDNLHARSPKSPKSPSTSKSPRNSVIIHGDLKRRSTSAGKSPRNHDVLDRGSGSKRRTQTAAGKSPRERVGSHEKRKEEAKSQDRTAASPLPIPKSAKTKVSRTPTLRRKRASSRSPQVQSPPQESGFPGMKVRTVSDFDELKARSVRASSSKAKATKAQDIFEKPADSDNASKGGSGFLDDVDKLALRLDLQQQELKTEKKKGGRLSVLKSPRSGGKEKKLSRLSFSERMVKRVSPRKFDSPLSPRRNKNKSPRVTSNAKSSKSPRVPTGGGGRTKSPRLEDLMAGANQLDSNPLHAFGLLTPRANEPEPEQEESTVEEI